MKRHFTEWETRGQEVQEEMLSLARGLVIREVPPKLLWGGPHTSDTGLKARCQGEDDRGSSHAPGPNGHDHSRPSRHVFSLQCG